MDGRIYQVLREVFGHSEFKGKQKEIVQAALSGSDVLVLAPTGMGKSLCFQVPAVVAKRGITIVVSPLLALMKNQISRLRQKKINVYAFNSETPAEEKAQIMADLSSGHPRTKLLYITPEGLFAGEFKRLLEAVYQTAEINRLVIDEAHCISEWGHDFRSEYRRLGSFRKLFEDVPIMALTATATNAVQADIIRTLGMSESNLFKAVHPFNRANLFYEVRYTSAPDSLAQMNAIAEYIHTLHRRRGQSSTGIIYCRAKKTCNELATHLRARGLNARPYHRGISPATLANTLNDWENGTVDVVCATIAFGMGIDKSDVRYIIHYDMPKSFEGYYQETGRAGRDGQPAKCILYYSREDTIRVRQLVADSHAKRIANTRDGPEPSQRSQGSLDALIKYAEDVKTCRHITICRYFGELINEEDQAVAKRYCENMCDVCKYPEKTRHRQKQLSPDLHASVQSKVVHVTVNSGSGWLSNFRDEGTEDSRSYPPKRSSSDTSNKENSKKVKVTLPPPLVTKSFKSASRLNKPFKTPFKASVDEQEPMQPPSISAAVTHVPTPPAETGRYDGTEEIVLATTNEAADDMTERASSPIEVPATEIKLDASFSQKIQSSIREDTFIRIRRTLHKVFMQSESNTLWEYLTKVPPDMAARNEILDFFAHKLEFSIQSMSATEAGYQRRMTSQLQVLSELRLFWTWSASFQANSDFEEAQEAINVLKHAYSEYMKSGCSYY